MWLFAITAGIVLFYFNVLHRYMPGDDYMFRMIFPAEGEIGTERILSLSDFIESQINIFNNCHYRILVHSLIQGFLLLPSWCFDLVNTLVFLILPWLLIPEKLRSDSNTLYLLLLCFIWIFHFDLGNAYFWTTGAINYTWTLIPLLLYVKTLLKIVNGKQHIERHLLWLSPLVASSNENALIALFIMTAVVMALHYLRDKKLSTSMLLTLVVLLLGGLVMVFSPSAAARMAREPFLYDNILSKGIEFTKRSVFYLLNYLPIIGLLLLGKPQWYKSKLVILLLTGIVFLSFISMFAAPIFEARSAVFGFMVAIMLVLEVVKIEKINSWLILCVFLFSIIVTLKRYPTFYKTSELIQKNELSLFANKGANNINLNRQCLSGLENYHICYDIEDRDTYINLSLERYYKIGSVELNPDHSPRTHWHKWKKKMSSPERWKEGMVGKNIGDYTAYLKEENNTLQLLIDLGTEPYPEDYLVIMRGARKNSLKHKALQLLPDRWTIYLLDYLEMTGNYSKGDEPLLMRPQDGHTYSFNLIADVEQYDYLLLSLYSFNNHTTVGGIYMLDL